MKNQIKNRYSYDNKKPLGKPYSQSGGIYNAYFKGFDMTEQQTVLISQYSSNKFQQVQALAKRVQQIQLIKHKNLSKIYDIDISNEQNKLILVLEWCQGGSILDYLNKQTYLDYSLAIGIISQIYQGLQTLHNDNIIHRFLNLENIQIDVNGVPKLTIKCLIFKTFYLSPEEKQNAQKKKENDIFALGVSLYRLIFGNSPFKGKTIQDYSNAVKEGPKFEFNVDQLFHLAIPYQIKAIISEMTDFNPINRMKNLQKLKKYIPKIQQNPIISSIFEKISQNKYIYASTNYQGQQQTLQQYMIINKNVQKKYIQQNHKLKQLINILIKDYHHL